MNGRFLLDTNIIIALFQRDTSVQENIAQTEQVFVSSTVVGELYYGVYKSRRVTANLTRIEEFVAKTSVLECDLVTAQQYGEIKNFLREKGRPIPENDIWIAAVTKQYELTLVSRDKHFSEIDGLFLVSW
ncbi:putative nucleic acid-binding protein, contains PIN domain [Cylindrospermum stagnale PCC 7417]|uniref:Ribonuclease VapC n=1 Tax=Cylindrospermum stagnale PCC 7417 TaxID=56107 RepID=K9X2W5_9NOST|nr:type II toxin-antitoxin system VapC family toxin [Cylindrospermum stagnale]AFZ26803.1 putative nucleic acid-binding protein, contains PIN domain [Cylindrospermum stagnale PCC 7417]